MGIKEFNVPDGGLNVNLPSTTKLNAPRSHLSPGRKVTVDIQAALMSTGHIDLATALADLLEDQCGYKDYSGEYSGELGAVYPERVYLLKDIVTGETLKVRSTVALTRDFIVEWRGHEYSVEEQLDEDAEYLVPPFVIKKK